MKAHPTREWRPPSVYQHRRWSSLGGDGVAVARTTVIGIRVEGFSGDGIVFFNTTHTTVRQLSLNRQRGYGITSFVGHDSRRLAARRRPPDETAPSTTSRSDSCTGIRRSGPTSSTSPAATASASTPTSARPRPASGSRAITATSATTAAAQQAGTPAPQCTSPSVASTRSARCRER